MFMYHADCTGNEKNCLYRHRVEITDEASLLEVVRHDYVCAEYQDGYRSNDKFTSSDCVAVDFDNDHSENPEDWVKPEQIIAALPGVTNMLADTIAKKRKAAEAAHSAAKEA